MINAANIVLSAIAACALLWTLHTARSLRKQRRDLDSKTLELAERNQQATQVEDRFRGLFETVPVAIMVSRMDGTLIDINRAGIDIFGCASRDEAMQLNMKSIYVNPAERERRIAAALVEPTLKAAEFMMRRKNGSTFAALAQQTIVRSADGKPSQIESFVTDISEYKRLEADRQALEQEQRLSTRLNSVGALAAGIAHEINTPMQFVSDSVYFLKTAVGELDALWPQLSTLAQAAQNGEDPSKAIQRIGETLATLDVSQLVADANESAERALEGIRRVTKIIRAMREFAHPDNGEHTEVDINNALETTLTVCKNVYKEIADVETDFGEMPPVMCQYGEVNQVFLNIIVNAAHAIEAHCGGTSKGLIRISTNTEDNWAVIRIQDNGTGIPDSVKARIFDPFFTTKEVGKGTGQGLAIVQSVIVGRHKGRITVDSEVGKGTTFILRLPIESHIGQGSGVSNEQEA